MYSDYSYHTRKIRALHFSWYLKKSIKFSSAISGKLSLSQTHHRGQIGSKPFLTWSMEARPCLSLHVPSVYKTSLEIMQTFLFKLFKSFWRQKTCGIKDFYYKCETYLYHLHINESYGLYIMVLLVAVCHKMQNLQDSFRNNMRSLKIRQ